MLTSPNYPNNYDDNDNCVFIISAKNKNFIKLRVDDFRLEGGNGCQYDYVEIRDGNSASSRQLGKYCGLRDYDQGVIPRFICSTGKHLRIK